MTARQLALGDCDPAWQQLADQPHAPDGRLRRDLRGQRLGHRTWRRIVTVRTVGEWL